MYIFTAHIPGDHEAPIVAIFDEIPTVDEIAEQFCNTVPDLQLMTVVFAMKEMGFDQMLDRVDEILGKRAAAGEWPSIGKLSEDGGMFFSMQMIVDRPKNRN